MAKFSSHEIAKIRFYKVGKFDRCFDCWGTQSCPQYTMQASVKVPAFAKL